MGVNSNQRGFTVVEMIVSLVVLSIFLTLFFNLYRSGEAQRVSVIRHAAANDIALTNLQKIQSKSRIPIGTLACDNSTVGSANPNNLLLDPSEETSPAQPDIGPGSTIAWSGTLTQESLSGTVLPSTAVQRLAVVYPRGCDLTAPAKIISTVKFGSETVTRAAFVN